MQVDFSSLGDLPNVYRQAQMQANRQRTLADLGQGGDVDYNAAAMRLMAGGDVQGAMTLANLGTNQRDFQFRQEQAKQQQTNADRTFALQKQTADEAARGFDYRELDDGAGGKTLVRINKQTGQTERVPIAGHDPTPLNPFMAGKMNESQSKDALYTSRMLAAERVLRGSDGQPGVETQGADYWQRRAQYVTDNTGFNVNSKDYQKFDQARRDFINATLRRESGAVIADSEFDNANKQYFPMPGDSPEVIKQKRANRAEAIRGIGAGAGPGYRPDYSFDQGGNLVSNPAAQRNQPVPASAPQPKPGLNQQSVAAARANPQSALAEAKQAIADGKDRNAVISRLKQIGIDPAGL